MTLPQSPSDGAIDFLTVHDAAGHLKVSRIPIWRWCKSGRLPAFKIGREWRIHRGVLEAMIQEHLQRD